MRKYQFIMNLLLFFPALLLGVSDEFYSKVDNSIYFDVNNSGILEILIDDSKGMIDLCNKVVRSSEFDLKSVEGQISHKDVGNGVFTIYMKDEKTPVNARYRADFGRKANDIASSDEIFRKIYGNLDGTFIVSVSKYISWDMDGHVDLVTWGDQDVVLKFKKGTGVRESIHIRTRDGSWFEVFWNEDGEIRKVNKSRSYEVRSMPTREEILNSFEKKKRERELMDGKELDFERDKEN
jgi:hypothetical protein